MNMMKKLTLILLCLACVGAWAQKLCSGTAYIRVPSTWLDLKVHDGLEENKIPASMYNPESDYYIVNLATVTSGLSGNFVVYTYNSEFSNIDMPGVWGISDIVYDGIVKGRPNGFSYDGIPCPGEGNVVYVDKNEMTGGTYIGSVPSHAKHLYVLIPDEREWLSGSLMIHYKTSSGEKDTLMGVEPDMCGWFSMVFEDAPIEAYMYLKNNPAMQIGLNGLSDEGKVNSIKLNQLFDAFGTDKLYFMPDQDDWLDGGASQGWYTMDPGVPENGDISRCSFSLAAIIYDTDKSVNPLFTEDVVDLPSQGGVASCVGVHQGMVLEDLGPDNKPQFNPKSIWGSACFGNEESFKTLFNYTPGRNEVQCYDMPFSHYGKDPRWAFNSDSMVVNNLKGGFSPLEYSTDVGVVTLDIDGVPTLAGPLPAARTKRPAAGPPSNNAEEVLGMPLDYYCKTPGWPTGNDCEGLFANGEEAVIGAIWCWGSYCDPSLKRWGDGAEYSESEMRNQHFCFESHATFTYSEDQEFTIRGDDDVWVFINKKIAIDLGGAHLPAPGHVVLKNLNDTYGEGFLVPGNDYPLDIFFCDRRTTMSNMIIKSNALYIKQSTGLDVKMVKKEDGSLGVNVCMEVVGGGDCASVALGKTQYKEVPCNEDIPVEIHYTIQTAKGDTVAVLTPGQVNYGGIDLTNSKQPSINPQKIEGLDPGSYRLYMEVNGKSTYYAFRIKANLDIIRGDVTFANADNEKSAYPAGTKWTYQENAKAGTRIPLYISAPDGQGGVDLLSAVGMEYTLTLSENAVAYSTNDSKNTTPLKKLTRTVDETGIDTVWVTVPEDALGSKTSVSASANIGGADVELTFWADSTKAAKADSTRKANSSSDSKGKSSNSSSDSKDKPSSSDSKKPNSSGSKESSEEFADPSFRVKMVGPFEFTIVMDSKLSAKKSYAVMDMQGNILKQGWIQSEETRIPSMPAGTYIVRVGFGKQIITVK